MRKGKSDRRPALPVPRGYPSRFTRRRLALAVDRTVPGKSDGFLATGRIVSLQDHFRLVRPEFAGAPLLCWLCARTIILIRRDLDPAIHWATLRFLMETPAYREVLLDHLNTRWLVSICDTYADHGTREERLAAISLTVLVNVVKLAETERLLTGDDRESTPEEREAFLSGFPHPLWDGVTSYLVESGDMPRNLFNRLRDTLVEAPPFDAIGETILQRLKETDGHLMARMGMLNPRFWE